MASDGECWLGAVGDIEKEALAQGEELGREAARISGVYEQGLLSGFQKAYALGVEIGFIESSVFGEGIGGESSAGSKGTDIQAKVQATNGNVSASDASERNGSSEGPGSRFPKSWGEPPQMQTRDLRQLPGGYGMGSSTLAKWIQEKINEDTKDAEIGSATSEAEPDTSPAASDRVFKRTGKLLAKIQSIPLVNNSNVDFEEEVKSLRATYVMRIDMLMFRGLSMIMLLYSISSCAPWNL